jgi:pimeloyl-ACP methyl ester carboxylesterase
MLSEPGSSGAAATDTVSRSTLVLLPGLDGTEVFFRPLLACLPPSIQPVILNYPDHGPYEYPELLALVCESLAEVKACYVLASSFGGPLGIMLAAAEPKKIRGLILCATFVRPPLPLLAPFSWVLRAPLLWSLRAMRRLPVWMRSQDDALRHAKRETWQRVSAHGLAARARSALKVDVRVALAHCLQPILNISFDRDTVVPRSNADEINSHRFGVTQVTLSGDHLAMFHDPTAVATEVVRFMNGADPNPAPFISRPI